MGTTLNVKLSAKSLRNAAKEVRKYEENLKKKNQQFVNKLLERGIEEARWWAKDSSGTFGTHRMGKLVTFSKEMSEETDGCSGMLIGMGQDVLSNISQGRSINSLLALEFGTAGLALPPQTAFHGYGGHGTNSEAGHENDLIWWVYVKDENGKTVPKKLSAIEPTRPLYHAAMEMLQTIQEVAIEVFATSQEIQC